MTNYEYYKEQIEKFTRLGIPFALNKETKKFDICYNIECADCMFCDALICADSKIKWADAEYIEPEVDWSKVPVDTPVLVRDSSVRGWIKRHFEEYKNGKVFAFDGGYTSWSLENISNVVSWKYAKLAEENKSE